MRFSIPSVASLRLLRQFVAGAEDPTVDTVDAEELHALLKGILAKLPVPSSREDTQAGGVATRKLIPLMISEHLWSCHPPSLASYFSSLKRGNVCEVFNCSPQKSECGCFRWQEEAKVPILKVPVGRNTFSKAGGSWRYFRDYIIQSSLSYITGEWTEFEEICA